MPASSTEAVSSIILGARVMISDTGALYGAPAAMPRRTRSVWVTMPCTETGEPTSTEPTPRVTISAATSPMDSTPVT
jgi:hypothetical protein